MSARRHRLLGLGQCSFRPAALAFGIIHNGFFFDFSEDEPGATAIEYGLIAGLIGVIIIAVLGNVGTKLNVKFTRVSNALN